MSMGCRIEVGLLCKKVVMSALIWADDHHMNVITVTDLTLRLKANITSVGVFPFDR